MNICVFGSSSDDINKEYFADGERLGETMAEAGHTMIFGGGCRGLMGACARGVSRAGGRMIGIVPTFFRNMGVLYEDCTEMIYTDTMNERKKLMDDMSDAFIITPGGVGTYDEFFEVLTLKHLGQIDKPIYILNTRGFFDLADQMIRNLTEEKFLGEEHLKDYEVFNTVEELKVKL